MPFAYIITRKLVTLLDVITAALNNFSQLKILYIHFP